MTAWVRSDAAPADLVAPGDHSTYLFHTTKWMDLLERGFGCNSVFMSNEAAGLSAGISVFKAGPFRVGYLGFPVGSIIGDGPLSASVFDDWRPALSGSKLVALRVPVSPFGPTVALDVPCDCVPETAIVDLPSWNLRDASKNRRRDVAKARRSGIEIIDATNAGDGSRLHDLYQRTMERNKGALRYTVAYFTELIRLAEHHPALRVLLAIFDGSIVGFNVVARHGETGYYLHGAFDWEAREQRPSALLMNEAISWAKEQGCGAFNLLSSPKGQDSLVRYKEQWGGVTKQHCTYTIPLRSTFTLFRAAERVYRAIRR